METIGIPNLCEHVPTSIIWACIAEIGARSLGKVPDISVAPAALPKATAVTATPVTRTTAERAAVLARKDLAEYFSATLADLDPELKKLPYMAALHKGIDEIRALLDVPEGQPFEQAQVQKVHDKAVALVHVITAAKP